MKGIGTQKTRFNEDVDEEVKSIRQDAAVKLRAGFLNKSHRHLDGLTVHSGQTSIRSGGMMSKQFAMNALDKYSEKSGVSKSRFADR